MHGLSEDYGTGTVPPAVVGPAGPDWRSVFHLAAHADDLSVGHLQTVAGNHLLLGHFALQLRSVRQADGQALVPQRILGPVIGGVEGRADRLLDETEGLHGARALWSSSPPTVSPGVKAEWDPIRRPLSPARPTSRRRYHGYEFRDLLRRLVATHDGAALLSARLAAPGTIAVGRPMPALLDRHGATLTRTDRLTRATPS